MPYHPSQLLASLVASPVSDSEIPFIVSARVCRALGGQAVSELIVTNSPRCQDPSRPKLKPAPVPEYSDTVSLVSLSYTASGGGVSTFCAYSHTPRYVLAQTTVCVSNADSIRQDVEVGSGCSPGKTISSPTQVLISPAGAVHCSKQAMFSQINTPGSVAFFCC